MRGRGMRAVRRAAVMCAALAPLAFSFAPRRVADDTRSGWFNVVWQTQGVENRLAAERFYLVDDQGRATELSMRPSDAAPLGGVLKLNGKWMSATGDLSLDRAAATGAPVLRVRTLRVAQGPRLALSAAVPAVTDPRPYIVIICRFSDAAGSDPHPRATYEQWMSGIYPGLDHYWREQSEGRTGMPGVVVGPYVLPATAASYVGTGGANLGNLLRDCTNAADGDVDFTQYRGLVMQFNSGLDGFSWGGGWRLTLDGVARTWPVAWMADWATQATYAHETGHSLGLPHSSGPYGATYDSRWDVMSGGGSTDASVGTRVAPHTIAFHKDMLGWIPAERKYTAGPQTDATFTLERQETPPAGGYLIAQIPIGSTGTFYTVETRQYAGYDIPGRLPGEAVVIHKVDYSGASPAHVVDPDGNGNPNDAGAMWLPGETFVDPAAGVSVAVLARTATGFRVEVSTLGALVVSGSDSLPAATMGAAYSHQFALAAGGTSPASWTLADGALPPGLTLTPGGLLAGVPERPGDYSFRVMASSGGQYGGRQVTLSVSRPQVAQAAVMEQVLGGAASLTPEQARFLDLLGNRNGRLDVGDVRAWLRDQGLPGGG